MDFFKKNITIIRNRFLFLKNQNESATGITPYRDWFIMVAMAILIGAVFISVSLYLFIVINGDEGTAPVESGMNASGFVNQEQLEEVLQSFSRKENEFQELLKTPPRLVDPSL